MVLMGGGSLHMGGTSRVTGDCQARFCERLGVKFPGATRPRGEIPRGYLPRGDVPNGVAGAGSASEDRAGDEPAGSETASGEDADGGLKTREGKLCVSGLHDSKEAEHTAEPAHAFYAAVAVAQSDEAHPGTRA